MRKYNKMLVSLMLCMLCCGTAHGVPAYPTKKTVKLEDGTEKNLQLMGDEFFNFYRAEDGQNYRLVTNGNFKLISDFEFGQQQEKGRVERTKTNARRARRRVGEFVEGGIKGKKKGLVILISFNDKDFVTPDPQTVFNDFFHCSVCNFDLLSCLLKIHDVNSFSSSIDILCHLRIPSLCLMSEMNTSF